MIRSRCTTAAISAALVATTLLAGCRGPTCSCRKASPPDGGELSAPVGLAGRLEVVTIPVPARLSVTGRSFETPTSAQVTVVDPNNHPIEVSVDPLPISGGGPLSLSFVPEVPGPYHVTARFETGFGDAQTDVQIAADRTDAGVVERALPFECLRFETAGGFDFCLDDVNGKLVTLIDGHPLSQVEAWDFARAPALSGVWVVADGGTTENTVRLYALDGGMLTLAFEQQIPAPNCPACGLSNVGRPYATLKARENRLLLVEVPEVLELTFDGGALAVNDLISGASLAPTLIAQWGPFGSAAVSGGAGVCLLPWDGGTCTPIGSSLLGADDELIWGYEPATSVLMGFGLPLDGGPPVEVRLPIISPELSASGPTLPHWSVDNGSAVTHLADGTASLEAFALPLANAPHFGIEPARIWRWDPDDGGMIRYIDR